MTTLVSNLTASNDTNLADVFMMQRREIPTLAPTLSPTPAFSGAPGVNATTNGTGANDGTNSATGGGQRNPTGTSPTNSNIGAISGSVVVAAALVILAAYFLVRKRRNRDVSESTDEFFQVNSDVESSMDTIDSIQKENNAASLGSPSTACSHGKSAADSIFSGLSECDIESPRHRGLMSKKSMSSQTTVQASGKGPATPTSLMTPTSLKGSLFVFEETSFEDDSSTPDVKQSDILGSTSVRSSTPRSGSTAINSPDIPVQDTICSTPKSDMAIASSSPSQKQSCFDYNEVCFNVESRSSGVNGASENANASNSLAMAQETPVQSNVHSTPATDVAIVNGQQPVTPPSLLLGAKTPETDVAVNLSLLDTSHNDDAFNRSLLDTSQQDAAIRELVFEGADSQNAPPTSPGLPPRSPASRSRGPTPSPGSRSRFSFFNFGSDENTGETFNGESNSMGALRATGPVVVPGVSSQGSTTLEVVEDLSSSGNSPVVMSPKRNKYTGLAATGGSAKTSPRLKKK